MSDNVYEFPTEEKAYWACNCGCMTFYVRVDGGIECPGCGMNTWDHGHLRVPDGADIPRLQMGDDPTPDTMIKWRDDEPNFPFERMAQRVKSGEFQALIGLKEGGGISTMKDRMPFNTPERRGWLLRRLREAYELLTKEDR